MAWIENASSKEEALHILQKQNVEINFKRLWQVKQRPCADCGLKWHPHCMSLDHKNRKSMKYTVNTLGEKKPVNIGKVLYWKPYVFNMQLKEMDAVCKNCNMSREAKRDTSDPKVSPRNKHLFPVWFEKCNGALVKEQ